MNIDTIRRERAPLWPIVLARMAIGGLWLLSLRWKLPPDFAPDAGRGLLDYLQLEAQYPALAVYGRFVESVVIPSFTLFAWLIFLAELLVGLSLLSGTLTRLGAAVGLLMALNLGAGMLAVPNEWPWSYVMLAMFHFIFLITAAGRVLGVDALLRQRLPANSPLRKLT